MQIPKKEKVAYWQRQVRMPERLWEKVKKIAESTGQSVNFVMSEVVRRGLEK